LEKQGYSIAALVEHLAQFVPADRMKYTTTRMAE